MKKRKRLCGECTECCTHIKCDALDKPAGVACEHLRVIPSPGCAIYDDRPHECKCFRCGWLDGSIAKELRPDRCGFIVERAWLNMPDGLQLTMLIVVTGTPTPEQVDVLRRSVKRRTIVLGRDFEMGAEADLALYRSWQSSVAAQGVIRSVDCDGTLTERRLGQ